MVRFLDSTGYWLTERWSPHARLRMGAALFWLATLAYPITLVGLSSEPPGIMVLSVMAVQFTGVDIVWTANVRKEQDDAVP